MKIIFSDKAKRFLKSKYSSVILTKRMESNSTYKVELSDASGKSQVAEPKALYLTTISRAVASKTNQ